MEKYGGRETGAERHAHLQVEELAVAPVNDFRAAIAPGHLDDVNLGKREKGVNKWKTDKVTADNQTVDASLPEGVESGKGDRMFARRHRAAVPLSDHISTAISCHDFVFRLWQIFDEVGF